MASTLSQAQVIKQFVCGMPLQERWWQAHLLDTQIGSILWHSHQMASTLSQAQMIKQFVCGMPQQERWWQAHLLVTQIMSGLWHSHQMASTLSQALSDQTIRVWNATTGEIVAGPFTGHTDSVNSVAFSPDGQYIVSGSSDQTICVWNATTGETSGNPFTGHTDWSFLWHSHQMAAHCLRLSMIEQFMCGMQ
jgi:hypothetical protein